MLILFFYLLYKSICCVYSSEFPRCQGNSNEYSQQVFIKKLINVYWRTLKTTTLLDCVLIGACVVIIANTVFFLFLRKK